jgi:hypothetical protein
MILEIAIARHIQEVQEHLRTRILATAWSCSIIVLWTTAQEWETTNIQKDSRRVQKWN